MGVADGAEVLLTGRLHTYTQTFLGLGLTLWVQWKWEGPLKRTGSETYSSRGSGLLRLLSQEGQHLLDLLFLFLADVVAVCGGGAVRVSRGSRRGQGTGEFSKERKRRSKWEQREEELPGEAGRDR